MLGRSVCSSQSNKQGSINQLDLVHIVKVCVTELLIFDLCELRYPWLRDSNMLMLFLYRGGIASYRPFWLETIYVCLAKRLNNYFSNKFLLKLLNKTPLLKDRFNEPIQIWCRQNELLYFIWNMIVVFTPSEYNGHVHRYVEYIQDVLTKHWQIGGTPW